MMECLKGIVSIEMVSRPSRVLGYMDDFVCYSSHIKDKCVCFVFISMIVQVRAAGIKEIRDRIGSVKNTKKITEAMKLVAAAKVRRAQEAVVNGRPFSENLVKVCGFFHGYKVVVSLLLFLSFLFSLLSSCHQCTCLSLSLTLFCLYFFFFFFFLFMMILCRILGTFLQYLAMWGDTNEYGIEFH